MRYLHTGQYCESCECDIPLGNNYLCEECEDILEAIEEDEV